MGRFEGKCDYGVGVRVRVRVRERENVYICIGIFGFVCVEVIGILGDGGWVVDVRMGREREGRGEDRGEERKGEKREEER